MNMIIPKARRRKKHNNKTGNAQKFLHVILGLASWNMAFMTTLFNFKFREIKEFFSDEKTLGDSLIENLHKGYVYIEIRGF